MLHRTSMTVFFLAAVQILIAAPDAAGSSLYVNSRNTNSVLQYNASTGAFTSTLVPSGSGGLSLPEDIVYGSDNNLYVSGFGDAAVHRYNSVTGASLSSFSIPGANSLRGETFGPHGLLYVAEETFSGGAIVRYNAFTNTGLSTFTSTSLANPQYMTFGPDGNLYVTDATEDSTAGVRRYNGTTGAFMGTFVPFGSGGLSNEPEGIAFGRDGNLYISDEIKNEVLRYNGTTGAFMSVFATGVGSPNQIAFGPDGNLYVTDKISSQILEFSGITGNLITAFVAPGSGGLNRPESLVFQPASVPEPSSLVLALIGSTLLLSLMIWLRVSGVRSSRPSPAG